MTKKEFNLIKENKRYYHIEYKTSYGNGVIDIDTKLFDKKIKVFQRLFKDCDIILFEEREKEV